MAADKKESHVVVKLLVTTNDPSNLTTAVDEREIVLSANIPSIAIGRSSKMIAKGFVPAKDNCWFDSPVMSRNHATLSVNMEDKKVTLVDEQSMHGTTVNFNETPLVPLHPHEVHDGDRITFGQTVNRQKDQFTPTTVELAVNFVDQESAVRTFSPDAADALSADEDSQSLPQLSDDNHRGSLDSWKNHKPDFRPYIDLTSPPPEPRPVDQAVSRRADHDDQGGAFKVVDEMSDGYGESIDLSDDGELSDDDVESSLGSSLSGAVVISDDDESDGSSGYPSQDYYERSDDRMWDYGEGWHESDNETDDQDMNPFDGPAPAAFDPWAEPDERTFTLKSILNPTTDRVASPIQEIMVSDRPLPTSMDASRAQAASPALGAVLEAPVPAVPEGFVKSLAPVVPESSLPEPASSVPEPITEPTASVTEITTSQGYPGRHTSVDFVSNPGEVNLPKGEEASQTQSVTEFEKRKFQAQVRRAYSLRYWPPDTPLAQSGEAFLNKPLENLPPRTEEETPIDEDVAVTSAATYHKLSKKRKALEISDAPEDAPEFAPVLEVAPRQDHPVQHQESEPRRIKAVGRKQSVRAMARAVAEKLCYAAVGGAVITAGLIYTSPTFA